jgi:hypothetical protein
MVSERQPGSDVKELADRLSMIAVEAYSPDRGLVTSVRGRVT